MRRSDQAVEFVEAGTVDYVEAWDRQRTLAQALADGTGRDTVLLLEHPSVYTAGKRTRPSDRPTDGTPVVDVDRGGLITWHGPGQLVGYPILALAEAVDVVGYVDALEQVLINVCAEFGVEAGRVPRRIGVWIAAGQGRPERKIAAIGVRITRGVSLHGFALNCDPDMTEFDRIVPCGIEDADVTSLTQEVGRRVTVAEVLPVVRRHLESALDGKLHVPAPAPASEPGVSAGIAWHLDPALAQR